jgi:hypothetical protein
MARATSARLNQSAGDRQDLSVEEKTPYFRHSRHQSNSIEPHYADIEISVLCRKILQEQNELRIQMSEQKKMIQNICKKKPPLHSSIDFESQLEKENKDVTFRPLMWPSSAREQQKRFRFPREVFTRKGHYRQN